MDVIRNSDITITPETIYRRYEALAQRVATEEEDLLPGLPIEDTQRLDDVLRGCITDWENERKSLRTTAVVNALGHAVDGTVPTVCLDVLVSLDAVINVLDDIIDDSAPSKADKIGYTANAAFATTLLYGSLPDSVRERATEQLFEYLTQLFQTPRVESELLAGMQRKTSREDQVAVATEIYQYRGLDIDAFVELALLLYTDSTQSDMEPSVRQALHEDLVTYRARRLLFKDVYDIQRDYRDDDVTPVLARVEATGDPAVVETFITDISNQFSYSAHSHDTYRSLLLYLERRPESLSEELSRQMAACAEL
jgi:hypothetical protein